MPMEGCIASSLVASIASINLIYCLGVNNEETIVFFNHIVK